MTPRLLFQLKDQSGPSVGDKERTPKTRCPLCKYVPERRDRWMCGPECRHVWNTFDTRGVCPACSYVWQDTACPRCQQWSPHEAWYTHHRND